MKINAHVFPREYDKHNFNAHEHAHACEFVNISICVYTCFAHVCAYVAFFTRQDRLSVATLTVLNHQMPGTTSSITSSFTSTSRSRTFSWHRIIREQRFSVFGTSEFCLLTPAIAPLFAARSPEKTYARSEAYSSLPRALSLVP